MRDIAFRAGFSERTVIRSVSELEALGFLAVIRNAGKSNKYILLLNNLSVSGGTEPQENDIESATSHKNEFYKDESQTNSQAYKIYHPEKTRKAGKVTAGKEMKHIKALLSGVPHYAK